MAAATLATADTRIYSAVAALVTAPVATATPLAFVDRFVGNVPPTGLPAAKFPAAMIRCNGTQAERPVATLTGLGTVDRVKASWSVLVQMTDPADVTRGVNGSAAFPGILRIVDAVTAVLNGLWLDDAYMERVLRLVSALPDPAVPSALIVYDVRFEAMLDAPSAYAAQVAAYEAAASDIEEMRGDVNVQGTVDPAPNPLVQLVAEPNE